jgi:hypothetical protein
MTTYINEFSVWDNQVPIIVIAGDPEFATWDNLIPIVDQDESNQDTVVRRRVTIF